VGKAPELTLAAPTLLAGLPANLAPAEALERARMRTWQYGKQRPLRRVVHGSRRGAAEMRRRGAGR